jgi:hypothetical protein
VDDDASAEPVMGLVAEATRAGEDTRRRGWFWHWNSIVTQFAPLIGLKGVGLLNSYTVWTDRREESPHRGYAFPSQQREADFYGEDRAELITINKILVALDLIEIRKEMVLRTDERGRRWRVPHNFYRVKDHDDGFMLTTGAVLRVVELADRDRAVYRYVRRIFSPRFAPIDADNLWNGILAEARQHEVWQRLAAKAERDEGRASARTKAGHAARKAALGMSNDSDTGAASRQANDSTSVTSGVAGQTSVEPSNKGLSPDVAPANTGLANDSTSVVDPVNRGGPTAVAPANTTYNQDSLTTTTTPPYLSEQLSQPVTPSTATASTSVTARAGAAAAGPGDAPPPGDAAGEQVAIRAFEDANGRSSTPAQRRILRDLAGRFDPAARIQAHQRCPSGWAWVTAAVHEAVEAGSAYVAPRRLREILSRWEREGFPGPETGRRDAADPVPAEPPPLGEGPDLPLPHGFGSRRTWSFTVGLLATAIDPRRLAPLVEGTWIAGYADGEVTLAAPDPAQAMQLAGEYRALVERKLSEAMRRPVRLAVQTPELPSPLTARVEPTPVVSAGESVEDAVLPAPFLVAECGLPSGHVWAAVLDELLDRGEVSRANVDAWLRATVLLGRDPRGALIVGAPHLLAQRRILSRFLPALREAAQAVIGAALPIEVVVIADWLRTGALAAERHPEVGRRGA